MNFIKLAPKKKFSPKNLESFLPTQDAYTWQNTFCENKRRSISKLEIPSLLFFFIFSAPGNIIILVSEIISLFLQLDPLPNQICSDDGSEIEYTASAGGNLPSSTFAFVHKSHFRPLGSQITAHARTFFCRKFEDYFTDCLIIR